MITGREEFYDENLCLAHHEIALLKWRNGYTCRTPGCNNSEYFEGKLPHSRRCAKCKKDESSTANTKFNNIRIPLNAALTLLKVIFERGGESPSMTQLLEIVYEREKFELKPEIATRFLLKMLRQIKISETRYSKKVLLLYNYSYILTADLLTNSINLSRKTLENFVSSNTTKKTKVFVSYLGTATDSASVYERSIRERPRWDITKQEFLSVAKPLSRFVSGFNNKKSNMEEAIYIRTFCFIFNGGTYEQLLEILLQPLR